MEPSPQSTSLPGNGDAASAFDTSTGESMMQTNVAGNTESARLDANSNTIMNIAPATAHGQSLQPNAFLNTNNEQLQYLNTQTINNSSPQTLDGGHLRASQTGDGFASPIQINLNSNNMDVGSSKDMAVNMNMDSMTNGDVNAGVNLGNNANANTGLLNEGQPRADNLKSSHEYTNTDAGVGSASGDANLYGLEKTQVDEQKELTRLLALMDDYTPTV
ncbi:hypothetical protein SARC_13416 [Sphaeroforma arctica JP610]|uniref:Uncharacterized protein n=1 Tax=Sphaeroforma arctica JP610 TaxID=667725 RepID=A0A0L0FC05_9EUKA|nr:hypothetical protein SARC_13416 [Sphaeroforma arctica JP610]KNC74026.1 hypothetical protein SARC_13416 [Sphaeroforma arctica JP610]|eukprot:XP_014147928.1 hypothetical protein SARC_13416 [Sphaeroforma arctica JP610]